MDIHGKIKNVNLHTVVIGGSGAGKTRYYAKPNIMQCNTSYVVLDPKGEIIKSVGYMLEDEGYEIKVIDLIDMSKSLGYNPFHYIQSDKDVLKLITNLIRNTTPKGSSTNDPFWEKSETALLEALMLYLYHYAPEDEQNFTMVMEMLNYAEVKEDEDDYESPLDELFKRLETIDSNSLALKQYKIYKQAAGVISLKRLLNHHFLRNWSSKMIKKSLEAYFLPKIQNCTFLKTFSKDGNILPRQSGYSVRSFSNRHKNPEKFKKVTLLPCKTASERWVK